MHLTIIPISVAGRRSPSVVVSGDEIEIDGTSYDFSGVPEGGDAQPGHPFHGAVTRQGGVIHCAVIIRIGSDAALRQPDDPEHWVIASAAGNVDVPYIRRAQ